MRFDSGLNSKAIARGSMTVLIFAVGAYVLLALAEQGGIGSQLNPVPQSPLPFDRSNVVGLDLADRSSIGALEWLQAAELEEIGLVSVAIDREIVAAVTDEATRAEAIRALDALFSSAGETPLAICLRQPISSFSNQELAETFTTAMRENFTGQIAYVSACDIEANQEWHHTLATELTGFPIGNQLIPLTVGEPVTIQLIDDPDELHQSHLRAFSGDQYVLIQYTAAQPLDSDFQSLATGAIDDAAQIALIMVRPVGDLDPNTFARSMSGYNVEASDLPEGFTNIYSIPGDQVQGFEPVHIGTVEYFRANQQPGTVFIEFIGTALYAVGLQTPDGGDARIWLDVPEGGAVGPPDATIDFSALQATNAAVALVSDLAAARHTVVLQTEGGEVSLSGFFVSGRPESRWNGGLASVSLLITAAVALATYSYIQIGDIRSRYFAPVQEGTELGHPREFTRGS